MLSSAPKAWGCLCGECISSRSFQPGKKHDQTHESALNKPQRTFREIKEFKLDVEGEKDFGAETLGAQGSPG